MSTPSMKHFPNPKGPGHIGPAERGHQKYRAAQPRPESMTDDPYLLDDGIPVLRLVEGRPAQLRREPVPFRAVRQAPGADAQRAIDAAAESARRGERGAAVDRGEAILIYVLVAAYLGAIVGVVYLSSLPRGV
jgi:hypothetical protein